MHMLVGEAPGWMHQYQDLQICTANAWCFAQVAKKIGLPWLLHGFDILLKDIQLVYMPKQLAPIGGQPGVDAGFMLACACDIPAVSAKGVKMTLVVTSTLKKFLVISMTIYAYERQCQKPQKCTTLALLLSLHSQV